MNSRIGLATETVCQVCSSGEWLDLPDPAEGRTITTAGRILNESLGKSQCAVCGFVQRIHARFLGHTDYYEQDYAKYYDRPGTTEFHVARYQVLAQWMSSVLSSFRPSRILDVGCGQGWAMEAMKTCYPDATIEGLEPSEYNAAVARGKGFVVYEARASLAALPEAKYDLVYSNNVIQHVTNAREFAASLKDMVSEDGRVVITCPDGSIPNIEILWGDQNFSFLPRHLVRLCREIGFENIKWFSSPPSPSVPPAQLLLMSKQPSGRYGQDDMNVPSPRLSDVYEAKREYLGAFKDIDSYLCAGAEGFDRVFNFGASYWSSILAAYCPNYWARVSACLVDSTDNGDQGFLDKDVLALSSVAPEDAVIVLGTSPISHSALRKKFSPAWRRVIAWDQFAPKY